MLFKYLIFQIQNTLKSIWNINAKYKTLNVFEKQIQNYFNVFKTVFQVLCISNTPQHCNYIVIHVGMHSHEDSARGHLANWIGGRFSGNSQRLVISVVFRISDKHD